MTLHLFISFILAIFILICLLVSLNIVTQLSSLIKREKDEKKAREIIK